jgi:hypothetical protein
MTQLPVLIPVGFTTTITAGTVVKVGDTLAEYKSIGEEAINLAEKLQVSPAKVAKMLLKNPGEKVHVGEILAAKSGFFASVQIKSKVSGTILRYERDSGKLIIAPKLGDLTATVGDKITAPVEGTVIEIGPAFVTVKTDKNVLSAVRGCGKAVSAELYFLEGKREEDLLYRLDSEAIGRIVLTVKTTRELLMKALGIGVAGVIVAEIWDPDLQYYKDKEKDIPLVMLEKDVFERVKGHKEKKVFVNGSEKVVVLLR